MHDRLGLLVNNHLIQRVELLKFRLTYIMCYTMHNLLYTIG